MSQQINLVNPELLPTQPHFTLNSMVQALGIIALALSLLAFFMHYQLRALEKEAMASDARVKAADARVKQLSEHIAQRRPNELLHTQIAEAQQEQQSLRQVAELLRNGGEPGAANGYSAQLYGLAQQTVSGVWLTGVSFHGERMSLNAMALNADRVPLYISSLKRIERLRGQDFSVFELQKTDASGNAVSANEAPATGRAQPQAVRFKLDAMQKEQPKP